MNPLNFRDGNPGAVQYGNFINYYKFNPPENRINLLPTSIFNKEEPFICLDIGCNAGDLTSSLHQFLSENVTENCQILAIDIDPILIKRAKESNTKSNITFECIDFMNKEARISLLSKYLTTFNCKRFSATFCFSITMWIHLNNGDAGLYQFLQDVYEISDLMVIEPQPWKCYRTAVKRLKLKNEEFSEFNKLKVRNNVENEIENMLLKFKGVIKIGESERTKWDRKLVFFKVCNLSR